MAKFGMLIFMLLPLLGNVYVLWHVWRILPLPSWAKVVVVTLMVFAFLLLFVGFSRHVHLSIPLATVVYEIGTSWLIILLYLFMTFLLLDIGRWVHLVPATFLHFPLWQYPLSSEGKTALNADYGKDAQS